jgi:hypothetical protein
MFKLLSLSTIFTQPFLHHHSGEIYSTYDILLGEEVTIKVETHLSMFSQLQNPMRCLGFAVVFLASNGLAWILIMPSWPLHYWDHHWKGSELLWSSDVPAWLGLEAMALAQLCMALALKNPGQGQGCRKPQATALSVKQVKILMTSECSITGLVGTNVKEINQAP